jgi:hypothetical protein
VRRLELEGARRHAPGTGAPPPDGADDPPSDAVEPATVIVANGDGARCVRGGWAGLAQTVEREAGGESVEHHECAGAGAGSAADARKWCGRMVVGRRLLGSRRRARSQ